VARPREFDVTLRVNVTEEQQDLLRRLRTLTGMRQSALIRAALEFYAGQVLTPTPTNKPRRSA
jgi:hypothetical protein